MLAATAEMSAEKLIALGRTFDADQMQARQPTSISNLSEYWLYLSPKKIAADIQTVLAFTSR
jgi:hypothetical protein